MAHYYLSPFVGTGAEDDPFRPDVAGPYSIIDLRADATVVDGWCLLNTDSTPPIDAIDLGDALDADVPLLVRSVMETELDVSLSETTLRGIIAELLIVHGSVVDSTKWKPLQAMIDGFHRIYLGGLIYEAAAPVGATITDDFNRANSDALGSSSEGWSWTENRGDMDIADNAATQGGVAVCDARAESDLDSDDHFAEIDASSPSADPTDFRRIGALARFASAATTYYGVMSRFAADDVRIEKWETGSFTNLGTTAHTYTDDSTVFVTRIEVDGSTIRAIIDGSEIASVTDTGITGNTRTGIGGDHDNGVWDNFEAGDLAAATSLVIPRRGLPGLIGR